MADNGEGIKRGETIMKRIDAIKDLENEIVKIENGPDEIEDYFAPGISAFPKADLDNKKQALAQYKAMSDEQFDAACQFND